MNESFLYSKIRKIGSYVYYSLFKAWQLFGFTEFLAWILEGWMAFLVKTFDHHPIHLLLLRPGETFST